MENHNTLSKKRIYQFPHPISKEEVVKLMTYLCEIGYNFSGGQSGFINARQDEAILIEDYINHISGSFSRSDPFGIAPVTFTSTNLENYPNFSGLAFNTAPGYDWEELESHQRRIIDDLRKDLEGYFTEI